MAYEDVLRDGQIGEEARLLVDDGNAERARVCGPVERHGLAVEHDGARIGLVDAREHLDDCALTGPVFADERMDLARQKRERDVQQRLRGPEPLRHPGEGHRRRYARGAGALDCVDGRAIGHDGISSAVESADRRELCEGVFSSPEAT